MANNLFWIMGTNVFIGWVLDIRKSIVLALAF